ncbi:hypothetical protein H5410_002214 [Solanum commersonii]|uniref:Uncharacterized protein n=1 Tax=Solanum commersonii TaxID=4109 RepID=A0A9J6B1C3_SOLCO|nr:hypothetical protein H5410_002214 [Solanum commersonii]
MDLQKLARDYNMSSRDPTIKIEVGLLNIYTRKHDQCNMCKLSASLGGGLAMLSAYVTAEIRLDLCEDERVIPLCVPSFSGPRVGNINKGLKDWE